MQSEKSEIRKKFGLDYLASSTELLEDSEQQRKVESLASKEVERAFVAVGGKILLILKDANNKSARLHDLVDETGVDLETLFHVVDRLNKLELIRYVEKDKRGNHEIQLTQIGENSLY